MVSFADGAHDPAQQQLGDQLFGTIFFTPEGFADPAPHYRRFLDEVPVHVSAFGGAILSRYDDCRQLLRDNRFGKGVDTPDNAFAERSPELQAARDEMLKRSAREATSMLGLDPPDHTRQRSLVSRAFTPRTVEKLRPRITELTEACLDTLEEQGAGDGMAADLMVAVATPLPVSVISEMLGVPETDWPTIRGPVTDLVASLEPSASVDDLRRSGTAREVLVEYFTNLITTRRNDPRDDLISALIAARDDKDQLSEGEILAVTILLFAAGAETTTNLIGNGVNQLLNHPDQLAALWADPSLVPSAVDEMLRFDSPVQLDGRMCLEPVEFAGLQFEPGERVLTLLGAANRDEEHFDRPDEFDIRRYAGEHPAEPVMSFASGIHYCLGANLARVEGQEVFAGLIRRFDSLEAAGERPYRQRMTLRGLETCPVRVAPRTVDRR